MKDRKTRKAHVQLDIRVKQLERENAELRAQLAEKALQKPKSGFSGSHDPWVMIAELRAANQQLQEENRELRESRLGERV